MRDVLKVKQRASKIPLPIAPWDVRDRQLFQTCEKALHLSPVPERGYTRWDEWGLAILTRCGITHENRAPLPRYEGPWQKVGLELDLSYKLDETKLNDILLGPARIEVGACDGSVRKDFRREE